MKHELASEKLLELAYGELSPDEARDVEAHAAGCEPCREELARIGETRSLMAQLPIEPAPERGERIVLAAAREAAEARGRKRSPILPPWLWAGSIGAMAAAVVAVVSWQLTREPIGPSLHPQSTELMGRGREEAPAKRAPVAKAKGDRAEDSEAARGAGGTASFAMADKAAPAAAPMRSAERKSAAPAAASPARPEPGEAETRTFAGCLGERRRIVERDGAGRVIRYVRIGEEETIEHRYAADGRLVSAVVFEGSERHVLPLDTPGLVRDARDAGIDAPPRCVP